MKMLKFIFPVSVTAIVIFLVYSSCSKDKSLSIPEGKQRVSIRLTDDPVLHFQEVNVDIQMVEVKVVPDSCMSRYGDHDDDDDDGNCGRDDDHDRYEHCAVWDTLDINPGIYNLLDLANGADTLLASGFTIQGRITKIRLTLGDANSVMIDSVKYPLKLWNNIHVVMISVRGENVSQISPNDLQLWLDFDAGRSIVKIRDNRFVLKPYLRLFIPDHTASLKGIILPREAHPVVAAIVNTDTLIAIPDRESGRFKIRGITGTTADVFINATANGYKDTTITGIGLAIGREMDIGTIRLHQ